MVLPPPSSQKRSGLTPGSLVLALPTVSTKRRAVRGRGRETMVSLDWPPKPLGCSQQMARAGWELCRALLSCVPISREGAELGHPCSEGLIPHVPNQGRRLGSTRWQKGRWQKLWDHLFIHTCHNSRSCSMPGVGDTKWKKTRHSPPSPADRSDINLTDRVMSLWP